MSINSYFHSRKSKNSTAVKQDGDNSFGAQAPQPIYDNLKKPTTTVQKKPCKNSILYYMTPTIKTCSEEPIKDKDELPCQIRKKIPITNIWDDILNEFDTEEFLYPAATCEQLNLQTKPESCRIRRKLELSALWDDIFDEYNPVSELGPNAPKRKWQENEDGTRNVRIRTCLNPDILNQSMLLEDYMEDLKEDLTRPLRTKLTLEQSNNILLKMADE